MAQVTYDEIKKAFQETVDSDKECIKLYKQIRAGDASYGTASLLSARIGEDLGKVLIKYAPNMTIDEIDLDDILPKVLGLDQRMVTTACEMVQKDMNKDAGLGIKYKNPKFDMDRVKGLIDEVKSHETFSDIEDAFVDQLANFSQNIVDESIRVNAQTMFKAGIRTMVVRQAEAGACPWCLEQAGSYDYNEVKDTGNDVWRRHDNCRCNIDYITERNSSFYTERVENFKE